MTKQQLMQKVKNQIAKRKADAESLCDTNYKNALTDVPFHTNDTNIRSVNLQIAKLEFQDKNTAYQNQLLDVLLKERKSILEKLGLTQKDLEPQYKCKICNDTGIFENSYCKCYKSLMAEYLRESCDNRIDINHTFENSDNKTNVNKKVYETMQQWCQKYPDVKFKNFTLCGSSGCGKTYLTECVANDLLSKGVVVQFITAFNFNNIMTKYHTTFDDSKNIYLDRVLDCDVLIIDDLGTEPINKNVTLEYLYLVINERQLKSKITIITSNLTLDEIINRYGERVFSRLNNKQICLTINMKGEDLRFLKK